MRELLFSITKKDLEIDFFSSGGPGGQHQNKTASGCRITHRASGAVGEARDTRSQLQNKKLALKRLVANKKFQTWWRVEANAQIYGKARLKRETDAWIEKMLQPANIKVEVKDDHGNWRTATAEEIERLDTGAELI